MQFAYHLVIYHFTSQAGGIAADHAEAVPSKKRKLDDTLLPPNPADPPAMPALADLLQEQAHLHALLGTGSLVPLQAPQQPYSMLDKHIVSLGCIVWHM